MTDAAFVAIEAIGQPDPFRVRYRNCIRKTICEVIKNKMNKMNASQFISKFANENIPSEDRIRFIEVAEIEISSLHEGNFARFKIRPSEFFDWQIGWV